MCKTLQYGAQSKTVYMMWFFLLEMNKNLEKDFDIQSPSTAPPQTTCWVTKEALMSDGSLAGGVMPQVWQYAADQSESPQRDGGTWRDYKRKSLEWIYPSTWRASLDHAPVVLGPSHYWPIDTNPVHWHNAHMACPKVRDMTFFPSLEDLKGTQYHVGFILRWPNHANVELSPPLSSCFS